MMDHILRMERALELAARGAGYVAPNPLVGAVLVARGRVIGEGFHTRFGAPHAEVEAIRAVQDPGLLAEATLYVTLEPCCHHGKTPPCTDLIIRTRIPRVVIGARDPFSRVAGRGAAALREAGIDVVEGVLAAECARQNTRFCTFHERGRPWVLLKWAETADGFIARPDSSSQWISGEAARRLAHQWRSEEAAVMVGTRTALIDNPALTVRHIEGPQPIRVVVDRELSLPHTLTLFDGRVPTVVLTRRDAPPPRPNVQWITLDPGQADAPALLAALHRADILSVMVEGGATLISSFIDAGLWDEARVFVSETRFGAGRAAPKLSGAPDCCEQIDRDTLQVWHHHPGHSGDTERRV